MTTFDLENPDPLPGDRLRDEAANLLTGRFGRPQREVRVGGKKVDLVFRRRDLGKETTLFVEAKDYAQPLKRSQVVEIWADYSGLIRGGQPATLLLVTRSGLTADAQAFVADEQSDMRHQTIWELENETLGLAEYVRGLSAIFDEDGLRSYYIEARGRCAVYSEDVSRSLAASAVGVFGVLKAWVADDDPRPVAILGGYGAGKSSLARRLVADQAAAALLDPLARRPVLIRLGELARHSSLEGLLGGMFSNDHRVDGFSVRRFLDLNAKGRLVIVLDGFDEMKHAMTWSDFRAQVADLNRLTGAAAKIVLLGRPSAFTSADEHYHVLRGMKRLGTGWRRLTDWPQFIEYELEEFTPAERSRFFVGYLTHLTTASTRLAVEGWIAGRVSEVERLADLEPELFAKPVHAKILVDLASDPTIDLSRFATGVTRWGLYEMFFASLSEREAAKAARRPIGDDRRLGFLRELAFWLWTKRGGVTSFSAADVPDDLFGDVESTEAPDVDSLRREMLVGSFLEKKSGDVYYFGHRSFAEYLVADRMISRPPGPLEQPVYSATVREGVLAFLREAPDRARFFAWTNSLSDPPDGVIHVEYLAFLAEMLGGVPRLRAALPDTSIWLPVLEAFDDRIDFAPATAVRLVAAMSTGNDNLFFLLLSFLQLQADASRPPAHELAVTVAAAVLDRLFARVRLDDTSANGTVGSDGHDARVLASAVVGDLIEGQYDRIIRLDGRRLMALKTESLRQAGVEVAFQDPVALADLSCSFDLSWPKVLAAMSEDGRDTARTYFRRAHDLRGVFTRENRPPSRRQNPR